MTSLPVLEEMLNALVDGIKGADTEAQDRVYRTIRNMIEPDNFAKVFQGDTQKTHAWFIDYLGMIERREDDAGSLFWIRHGFELHLWMTFHDVDETKLEAIEIANHVADEIEGSATIFSKPEFTERTVINSIATTEPLHQGLHEHVTLSVEITATQFKSV